MSLLEGSLAALQTGQQTFSNQYDKRRQREALKINREQQDNYNVEAARIARKDKARTTVGNVNAAIGQGKEWNKTDGLALLEQRPELAIEMFNDDASQEYRKFTNENGETVGSTVVRVDKNKDGSYTPMVERFDTKEIVPMTVGRSAENTAVVKLSPEDVQNTINSRYQAAITDGGLENTSSVLSSAQGIVANRAKQAALDLAIEKIQNQDERAQFYQQINNIDIEEDGALEALLSVFKSVGGDPEALKAEGQAAANEVFAQNLEKTDAFAEGSLGERLQASGVTREKWEALTPEEQAEVAGRLQAGQDWSKLFDETVGAVGARLYDLGTAPFEMAAEGFESLQKSWLGRKLGMSEVTDFNNESPNYGERVEANEAAIRRESTPVTADRIDAMYNPPTTKTQPGRVPKGTGVGGPAPTPSDPVIAPPPFELTAENVRDAILKKTADPTDEQKTQINTFLKAKGIDNDAQLESALKRGEINRQEGLMLGWVLGATAEGDTNVKAGIAQNIENLIVRGDQDVGTLQQAQLESAQAQGAAATSQAQTAYAEFQLQNKRFDSTQAEALAQTGAAAYLKIQQELGLMDENGEPTDNDFEATDSNTRKIARRIPGFTKRLMRAQGPLEAEAGMVALNGMLGLYMQAKAKSDPNGILSGENFKDIFRPEPNGSVDFDANNVRVAEKNASGNVTKIAYVRDGVLSQAVSVSDLKDDEASVAGLLITAAKKNEENGKTVPK
jgi:hypothetical protein